MTILKNDRDSKSKQVDQLVLEASQFVFDQENKLAEFTTVESERDNLKRHLETVEEQLKDDQNTAIISQLKGQLQSKDDVLLMKVQCISKLRETAETEKLALIEKDKEISDLRNRLETAQPVNNDSSGNNVFYLTL